VLNIHSLDGSSPDFPFVSSQKYNVFDEIKLAKRQDPVAGDSPSKAPFVVAPPSQQQQGSKLTLIDVHGILMIIAWLMLVGVAVYSARYMRSVWANTTIMGLKIWFHVMSHFILRFPF
jgi:hypothetical protein